MANSLCRSIGCARARGPNRKPRILNMEWTLSKCKGGMTMTMQYTTRRSDDVTILDLTGRLSLGEAVAFGPGSGLVLSETIRELAKKGQKKILLNLAGVTYVDSSGVGQLVGALTTARNQAAKAVYPCPRSAANHQTGRRVRYPGGRNRCDPVVL